MKQTAVEWLVEQLNEKIDFIPLDKWDMIRDIIQQAKAMEKWQMINWYATGQADTVKMYEQHLNKTFNTNEK
jgi:uncharacterized protein YcaQ